MTRIGVILAGGASRRMGGEDKGALMLGGRRLIDHVIEKLAPQVDRLIIAGPDDFKTEHAAVPDRSDGPAGPAAGLWAAAHWAKENAPQADGFLTAPIDGPFLPDDLYKQLSSGGACAVASDDSGDHATFAFWELSALTPVLKAMKQGEGVALQDIAKKCKAKRVSIAGGKALMNINTPEDLAKAEEMLA